MKVITQDELRKMSTSELNASYTTIKQALEHYQAKTHPCYDIRISEYDSKMDAAKTQEECTESYIQLIYWMARKLTDAIVSYLNSINALDYINLIK